MDSEKLNCKGNESNDYFWALLEMKSYKYDLFQKANPVQTKISIQRINFCDVNDL